MAQGGLQQAFDARRMELLVIVLSLVAAQFFKNGQHARVPQRREDGQGSFKSVAVERRELRQIAGDHFFPQILRHVAPRVFEQRHEVVGDRALVGVLKIQQPGPPDAVAVGQQHQVGGVIIAQQQRRRHRVRDRQHFAPGFPEFGAAGFGNARRAPVQKQFDVLQHFFRRIGAQIFGHGLRMPVQGNQDIGGEREKLFPASAARLSSNCAKVVSPKSSSSSRPSGSSRAEFPAR